MKNATVIKFWSAKLTRMPFTSTTPSASSDFTEMCLELLLPPITIRTPHRRIIQAANSRLLKFGAETHSDSPTLPSSPVPRNILFIGQRHRASSNSAFYWSDSGARATTIHTTLLAAFSWSSWCPICARLVVYYACANILRYESSVNH